MILETLCLLVCASHAAILQIEGMLSIDLKLPKQHQKKPVLEKVVPEVNNSQVTAGPAAAAAAAAGECIYQYPEKKQVDAILSNMMNVLTKVFVRVHNFFASADDRRAPNDEGARHQGSRFKVIDQKNTQFFEYIYHNMTHEYSKFFNETKERVDRSSRDPCQQQEELKKTWRELVERSLGSVRRAALRCVRDQLRLQRPDASRRGRLGQLLARELAKARSSQLHLLCDHFQLCFNELH